MQNCRRLALVVLVFDLIPGLAEKIDVGTDFFVGRFACCCTHDESAGICAACFADQTPQPRAVFGAGDFARYTDVIDRRHVNQKASRQRDMACDARTLFAERFLGDLHHDFLARLQHFGNELRTTGMSVSGTPMVAAVLLIPATATRPALEPSAPAPPVTTAISATIRTPATPTISASAAERPLKT